MLRTIRLGAEAWDRVPLDEQERIFGRRKSTGAPLDGKKESDPLDYGRDPQGRVTPLDSHIRRANPRTPGSEDSVLLRRSYSVDRGLAPRQGRSMWGWSSAATSGCRTAVRDSAEAAGGRAVRGLQHHDGRRLLLALPGVADASDWYGSALLGS